MPRFFKKIEKDKFRNKVVEAFDKEECVTELTPQVKKDLSKCKFDLENESSGEFGPVGLMGYRTTEDGLNFLGCCAGGDWEWPVFFIIYWDGKKLRGYIPRKGNPWNTDTGRAYGNALDTWCEQGHDICKFNENDNIDIDNMKKRYPNLIGEDGFINQDQVRFDPAAILQDIRNRIKESE